MTQRLTDILLARWAEIDGFAAGQGLPDLEEMEQDRLDNFVWWFITKDAADPVEVQKFRNRLWQPPKGQEVTDTRSPWHPDAETAAFQQARAQLTGAG